MQIGLWSAATTTTATTTTVSTVSTTTTTTTTLIPRVTSHREADGLSETPTVTSL